jgi:membrane-bound ClpP family serine protease
MKYLAVALMIAALILIVVSVMHREWISLMTNIILFVTNAMLYITNVNTEMERLNAQRNRR